MRKLLFISSFLISFSAHAGQFMGGDCKFQDAKEILKSVSIVSLSEDKGYTDSFIDCAEEYLSSAKGQKDKFKNDANDSIEKLKAVNTFANCVQPGATNSQFDDLILEEFKNVYIVTPDCHGNVNATPLSKDEKVQINKLVNNTFENLNYAESYNAVWDESLDELIDSYVEKFYSYSGDEKEPSAKDITDVICSGGPVWKLGDGCGDSRSKVQSKISSKLAQAKKSGVKRSKKSDMLKAINGVFSKESPLNNSLQKFARNAKVIEGKIFDKKIKLMDSIDFADTDTKQSFEGYVRDYYNAALDKRNGDASLLLGRYFQKKDETQIRSNDERVMDSQNDIVDVVENGKTVRKLKIKEHKSVSKSDVDKAVEDFKKQGAEMLAQLLSAKKSSPTNLEMLYRTYPNAAGKAVARNPQYGGAICDSINTVKRKIEADTNFNYAVEQGMMVANLAALGGMGTGFLLSKGLKSIAAKRFGTNLTKAASSAAVGLGGGDLLVSASNLKRWNNLLDQKLNSYMTSKKDDFKNAIEAIEARNEYKTRLLDTWINGVAFGVDVTAGVVAVKSANKLKRTYERENVESVLLKPASSRTATPLHEDIVFRNIPLDYNNNMKFYKAMEKGLRGKSVSEVRNFMGTMFVRLKESKQNSPNEIKKFLKVLEDFDKLDVRARDEFVAAVMDGKYSVPESLLRAVQKSAADGKIDKKTADKIITSIGKLNPRDTKLAKKAADAKSVVAKNGESISGGGSVDDALETVIRNASSNGSSKVESLYKTLDKMPKAKADEVKKKIVKYATRLKDPAKKQAFNDFVGSIGDLGQELTPAVTRILSRGDNFNPDEVVGALKKAIDNQTIGANTANKVLNSLETIGLSNRGKRIAAQIRRKKDNFAAKFNNKTYKTVSDALGNENLTGKALKIMLKMEPEDRARVAQKIADLITANKNNPELSTKLKTSLYEYDNLPQSAQKAFRRELQSGNSINVDRLNDIVNIGKGGPKKVDKAFASYLKGSNSSDFVLTTAKKNELGLVDNYTPISKNLVSKNDILKAVDDEAYYDTMKGFKELGMSDDEMNIARELLALMKKENPKMRPRKLADKLREKVTTCGAPR